MHGLPEYYIHNTDALLSIDWLNTPKLIQLYSQPIPKCFTGIVWTYSTDQCEQAAIL
jgi:hypothetical protein